MIVFRWQIMIWSIVILTSFISTGTSEAKGFLRTVLNVRNIYCSSCLRVIESELRKTPGIIGMSSDLRQGIVIADHDSDVSSGEVASVVSRLGYPARVASSVPIEKKLVRVFPRFAGYGTSPGGCSLGGCNPVADSWKELYRRFLKKERK